MNGKRVPTQQHFHPDKLVLLSPLKGVDVCIYPVALVGDISVESKKLSARDQVRLRAIKHPQKQKEFVASRLALKQLEPNYRLTYEGRIPFMTNGKFVSLSHAHKVGAAILSTDKDVGIDVELQREQLFRIAAKFLHPDEKFAIRPERALEDLHVYWGAKECLFKIWKYGEVDFSHELRVADFESTDAGQTTATIFKGGKEIACHIHYQLVEGYHLVFGWAIG